MEEGEKQEEEEESNDEQEEEAEDDSVLFVSTRSGRFAGSWRLSSHIGEL